MVNSQISVRQPLETLAGDPSVANKSSYFTTIPKRIIEMDCSNLRGHKKVATSNNQHKIKNDCS